MSDHLVDAITRYEEAIGRPYLATVRERTKLVIPPITFPAEVVKEMLRGLELTKEECDEIAEVLLTCYPPE